MAIAISKIKNYMMSRINQDDISVVEMVDRYLMILKVFREAEESVAKDGSRIVVENGNQSYVKSHPLISDMKNLNAQLINLKKDIDKHIIEFEKSKPKSGQKEGLL